MCCPLAGTSRPTQISSKGSAASAWLPERRGVKAEGSTPNGETSNFSHSYARSQLMKLSPVSAWDKFEVSPLGVDAATFTPRPFRDHIEITSAFELICERFRQI